MILHVLIILALIFFGNYFISKKKHKEVDMTNEVKKFGENLANTSIVVFFVMIMVLIIYMLFGLFFTTH